jgi:3-deoxy-D-manno-octulosonic-acid transferase
MHLIYSAILAAALLLSLPYWLWQMALYSKYRDGLRQKLGHVPSHLTRDSKPAIWIHAVSVGEVLAVSRLAKELQSEFPEYRVVISTTTPTGQKLARQHFGNDNVFYFPLDLGFAIRPYIEALHLRLIVIAETEFWPNFLHLAKASGANIAVVNARISDRSFPGYRRWRRLFSVILRPVDIFLAQTGEDANRLALIGAPKDRIQVSGNLKYDIEIHHPANESNIVTRLRTSLQAGNAGPTIVCGSTVEDEERLLLSAFQNVAATHPNAVMILAPRHPERFNQVANLLDELKISFVRRSLWDGEPICPGVFLLDGIGELAAIYALADIAFVGGSLVPRGGHNIIEPAQHGIAIVVGHHTENFRDILSFFQQRNAVRVVVPAELPLAWLELLANPDERAAMGQRALEAMQLQKGATERTLQALRHLLHGALTSVAGRPS